MNSGSQGFSRRKSRMIRWSLNAFLVFHVLGILLAPLGLNYIGHRMGPWMEPYLRTLQLASSWGFFAPDPGPPPMYLEFELEGEDGRWNEVHRWPHSAENYFLRERFIWNLAVSRHLINQGANVGEVFGPYVCKSFPKSEVIRFFAVSEDVPALVDIQSGKRKLGDLKVLDRRYLATVRCGGLNV